MVLPTIPISSIRPNDILFLLFLGAVLELTQRFLKSTSKSRSTQEQTLRQQLSTLRYETNEKRKLGPSAFVQTAKLERQVLSKEKDLKKITDARSAKVAKLDKTMKNIGMMMNIAIFLVYYGVELITIDGFRVTMMKNAMGSSAGIESNEDVEQQNAASFLKGLLFPISYGIAARLSRLGGLKASSVGALFVFWSAQTTTGHVYECLESFYLR